MEEVYLAFPSHANQIFDLYANELSLVMGGHDDEDENEKPSNIVHYKANIEETYIKNSFVD